MPFIKSSFTRYRIGAIDTVQIPVGWTDIYNRSVGAIASIEALRSTSGQLDFPRQLASLLRTRDILVDNTSGRIFVLVQLVEHAQYVRYLAGEIYAPIPDDFDSGVIEEWWTALGDWVLTNYLTSVPVSDTPYPNGADFLYQTLSSDFDVYARVYLGSSTDGGFALIRAGAGLIDCVTVGLKQVGTVCYFVRQDYYNDGTPHLTETLGSAWGLDTWALVRLVRRGISFHAYSSSVAMEPTKGKPIVWSEIGPPTSPLTVDVDTVPILVGPALYFTVNSVDARFDWFRNFYLQ